MLRSPITRVLVQPGIGKSQHSSMLGGVKQCEQNARLMPNEYIILA